jgi:hypothetical protein
MQFQVTVTVYDGDAFLYTADAAADQVIAALGGNPTKDFATVQINQASYGTAGVAPATPEFAPQPPPPVAPA